MERIRICTGYDLDGKRLTTPPATADGLGRCRPCYLDLPGWEESTLGATAYDALPQNARSYLAKIEELSGLPIELISSGPDRAHTIIRRHPFDA
jgi:adenylosuccinate synthase